MFLMDNFLKNLISRNIVNGAKICRKAQFKRINIDVVANLRGNYHKLIDNFYKSLIQFDSF